MTTSRILLVSAWALASCMARDGAAPPAAPGPDAVAKDLPHPGCPEGSRLETAPDEAAAAAIPIDEGGPGELAVAERAAFLSARPVFARHCLRCHTRGSKKVKPSTLDHLDMTAYPFQSRHGDRLAVRVRSVLGLDGDQARMPMVGSGCLAPEDRARIAAWADAFDRARGAR